MSQPSAQPALTPQLCFSTRTLRDFLRLSRASIDDTISQNLNALVTPSRAGFDPTSTSQRATSNQQKAISPDSCRSFRDRVLFPSWEARTEVINYCSMVATSPDPEDPEAAVRDLQNQKDRERVVNERLDPYSGRFFPQEARTEMLASLLRQERVVESIVRARTWEVVTGRCGGESGQWEDALSKWRAETRSQRIAEDSR